MIQTKVARPNGQRERTASHCDDFDTLQSGLTVAMIATARRDLKTCRKSDLISAVLKDLRSCERYDYLPVTDAKGDGSNGIVGLFPTRENLIGEVRPSSLVHERLCPLSEDSLIGANASILHYMIEGHVKPFRLVVSEAGIVGLVTPSDLQKPPARIAIFSLITGFEVTMATVIRDRFPANTWMNFLSEGRRSITHRAIASFRSPEKDKFVDSLLLTQFCDKFDILAKQDYFGRHFSKSMARKELKNIQRLRDLLAHANEYADETICSVIRTLLKMRSCLVEQP